MGFNAEYMGEVPQIQTAEVLRQDAVAQTREVVKQIPRVTMQYREKVVELRDQIREEMIDQGPQVQQFQTVAYNTMQAPVVEYAQPQQTVQYIQSQPQMQYIQQPQMMMQEQVQYIQEPQIMQEQVQYVQQPQMIQSQPVQYIQQPQMIGTQTMMGQPQYTTQYM